jgi:hypothetical protein
VAGAEGIKTADAGGLRLQFPVFDFSFLFFDLRKQAIFLGQVKN